MTNCPKCNSKVIVHNRVKKDAIEYRCLFCNYRFEVNKDGKQQEERQ